MSAPELVADRPVPGQPRAYDFPTTVRTTLANGLRVIRLRGGLREALRFFHTTDPAITRKRSIEGVAIKSDAPLGVASPLG